MTRRILLAALGLAAPAALHAQLPRITARSLGMANSYTAAARGYEAIAWNPALLGMPGRPSFSVNVVQASAQTWSNAFDLSDVLKYSGDTLTTEDKDVILGKIPDDAPMTLGATVDASALAVTIGNFGIAVGGVGDVESRVGRDFVELFLFGNSARRSPGDPPYSSDSAHARGWAGGTVALAYGMPFHVGVGTLGVGITAKITQGFMLAGFQDLGTQLQNVPFVGEVRMHGMYMKPDSSLTNGLGFGADLGFAYVLGSGLELGLAVENAISTMSWDEDALFYQRREYILSQVGTTYVDSVVSEIEETPFDANDPLQAALRDSLVGGRTFPMRVRAGAQVRAGKFVLAGDAMVRLASGLVAGESRRVSAGAELPLGVVAFRAGVSSDLETGMAMGGGLGFKAGPVRLDGGASWSPGGDRQGLVIGFGLSVMN
jgi:hypothetical protein